MSECRAHSRELGVHRTPGALADEPAAGVCVRMLVRVHLQVMLASLDAMRSFCRCVASLTLAKAFYAPAHPLPALRPLSILFDASSSCLLHPLKIRCGSALSGPATVFPLAERVPAYPSIC